MLSILGCDTPRIQRYSVKRAITRLLLILDCVAPYTVLLRSAS